MARKDTPKKKDVNQLAKHIVDSLTADKEDKKPKKKAPKAKKR